MKRDLRGAPMTALQAGRWYWWFGDLRLLLDHRFGDHEDVRGQRGRGALDQYAAITADDLDQLEVRWHRAKTGPRRPMADVYLDAILHAVRPANGLRPYRVPLEPGESWGPWGRPALYPPRPGTRVHVIAGEHAGRSGIAQDPDARLRALDAVMKPTGDIASRIRSQLVVPDAHVAVALDAELGCTAAGGGRGGRGWCQVNVPLLDILVI